MRRISHISNVTSRFSRDASDFTHFCPQQPMAFVNDPEYQPYVKARQAGSVSQFYMIDDTDLAGTVTYLPAA